MEIQTWIEDIVRLAQQDKASPPWCHRGQNLLATVFAPLIKAFLGDPGRSDSLSALLGAMAQRLTEARKNTVKHSP
jgi:hypothetical protein